MMLPAYGTGWLSLNVLPATSAGAKRPEKLSSMENKQCGMWEKSMTENTFRRTKGG